jgi:hypothetical protein
MRRVNMFGGLDTYLYLVRTEFGRYVSRSDATEKKRKLYAQRRAGSIHTHTYTHTPI